MIIYGNTDFNRFIFVVVVVLIKIMNIPSKSSVFLFHDSEVALVVQHTYEIGSQIVVEDFNSLHFIIDRTRLEV